MVKITGFVNQKRGFVMATTYYYIDKISNYFKDWLHKLQSKQRIKLESNLYARLQGEKIAVYYQNRNMRFGNTILTIQKLSDKEFLLEIKYCVASPTTRRKLDGLMCMVFASTSRRVWHGQKDYEQYLKTTAYNDRDRFYKFASEYTYKITVDEKDKTAVISGDLTEVNARLKPFESPSIVAIDNSVLTIPKR